MDVVVIFNGLGNQMSQYAFYLQKKSVNKSTYLIDFCSSQNHNGMELHRVFDIDLKVTLFQRFLMVLFKILIVEKYKIIVKPLRSLLRFFNCNVIYENFNYSFNSSYLLPSKGITFYYGGWHSEKYFLSVKDKIVKEFEFLKPIDPENVDYIHSISKHNSIGIHIRRGDYLDADNFNLFGDVCNKAYFEAAIDLIENKLNNPHFFVFSNDMSWVKANLFMNKVTYITCNNGKNSWKDMYLMSLCKHNIISNSTFSWWGAWLNKNVDKLVISPKRYLKKDKFTDFYPESWTKLADY
ncbi:alpha-1,2-fucosyltransferase [Mucilaginibacter sabulilitoris]|uniref:Alpha-1,2-fucosyltransferase n=1 Tax=Mucilaginibacter sabulilitoris TaxID=1173583 RepID=A0ABZ0TSQ3_9SPHI|nr:alpha-1,2-fucosyltransferase [Mucilaginibacter sabulilitoris]WPU95796.1 alpha-1,2-fucosyltransferase [Mucilaginibacter sabulilitoris]